MHMKVTQMTHILAPGTLLLLAVSGFGQVGSSTPGWFEFDVPGLDAPDGSPADMGWPQWR